MTRFYFQGDTGREIGVPGHHHVEGPGAVAAPDLAEATGEGLRS